MARRPNLKPPGRCEFCSGAGLSKGHIWPKWLGAHNPAHGDMSAVTMGKFDTFEPIVAVPPFREEIRQGSSGSRKARVVCKTCNSGWMSRIEAAAKPVVLKLMRDEPDYISTAEQRQISAWLCLVTIMVEFLDRGTQSVPRMDRDWLRQKAEPPPTWKIWLARYREDRWDDLVCRHTGMQTVPSDLVGKPPPVGFRPGKCDTQVTTMVIGHLCAHIFSTSTGYPLNGYRGVSLQPVWPAQRYSIFWPLVSVLSTPDVIELSEAAPRNGLPFPGFG